MTTVAHQPLVPGVPSAPTGYTPCVTDATDEDHPDQATDGPTESDGLARRLCRVVPSLPTQALRMAFVRDALQTADPSVAARALDAVCARNQSRNEAASEVLLAFTGLLQEPELSPWVETLRRIAEGDDLGSLRLHLRAPDGRSRLAPGVVPDDERRVPDYGRGRTLTLGERKNLARRPSRRLMDRLIADPHPSVIQNLLNNSVTTEDDIVRLAAKRPLRSEIMVEIARHPRWNVRRRVRLALVLNPGCPPDLGVPLVGLLLRSELQTLVQITGVHPEIRQAAIERLRG